MANRKPLKKSVRFEVFKRDDFTCQYCGQKAPDVVLQCDHIKPVSKGGDDDITNLITSCVDCNSGKGARELDDDTVIAKQRAQLEELNERRQQLEMMLEWREGLRDIGDQELDAIKAEIESHTKDHYSINENGERNIQKWLKRFTVEEIFDGIETSFGQYLKFDADGRPNDESWDKAFNYVPRIIMAKRQGGIPDDIMELFYVRGILRNRLHYVNERDVMPLLKEAHQHGADIELMKQFAKEVRNWTEFQGVLNDFINMQLRKSDGED